MSVDAEPGTAGDTTDMPGNIELLTTPDGQNISTTRIKIDSAGEVHFSTGQITMNDNYKILLGTGDDASLTYDGTNLVVNPKEVGAGVVNITGGIQCDSVTNDTGLAHGTFTPTRSAESNLDANVTPSEAQYLRVGNTVTVSGRVTADPTTTATSTSYELTLPIASDIGAVEDAAGVAFCGPISEGAEVMGVVANDTVQILWVATDVTSQTWSYTYTYTVQ